MTELPAEIRLTLQDEYGLELIDAEPLTGGWDIHVKSWLAQSELGPLVVRRDRSLTAASADWLGALLDAAGRGGVPVSAPLRTRDGAAGAAFDDHSVTVRPYVEGRTVDRDRRDEAAASGGVLARLHAALRGFDRPRPDRSLWHPALWPGHDDPEPLWDRALDRFEAALRSDRRFADTIVHGDYWADNLIWSAEHVAAVIDWSEARHDKALREVARATWEFGKCAAGDDLDSERARAFLDAYHEAAGGLENGTAEVLVPLMRHEVRLDARHAYWEAACHGAQGWREHADGLVRAFARLRHVDSALLLA